MATASLSSFTWGGQYSSSSGWLSNRNCYCNPAEVYFWCPSVTGQTTGRTIEVHVPIVYNNTSIPCYAKLTVNGSTYYNSWPQYCTPNASGINLSISFYDVTIPSGGASATVNIDFGDYNAVQLYSDLWTPYGYMSYTAVTSCGAPTSIWGSSNRIIPGQSYTFSWSGASGGVSNSISDYYVAYRYGSGSWIYDSASSTSYSFTPSTSYRGSTLQFAVQTRGSAGSSYYSNWAYSGYYTINSLPPAPTVEVDTSYYSYDNGGDITFTTSVDSDAEGDSLTIQYSTDSSFSSKTTYSGPFTINFKSSVSNATYYFRTYDGYEYSAVTSKTVYRNTPPTINNLGLSYTLLPGKLSDTNYIRSISTIPKVSKTVTYTWVLYYNSSKTVSGASSKWLSANANNTFDLSGYKGKYIWLRLTVNDGYDSRQSESGWFLVPTDISSASGVSITNGSGSNIVEPINSVLYTGDIIYVNWTLPAISDTQLSRYSQVELQKQNEDNSWSQIKSYPATTSSTSTMTYTETYFLPSEIGYNSKYRIIISTKEDSPGTQSKSYEYTSCTLQRAPKPELAAIGLSMVVSPTIIRPTSGDTGALGSTVSGSDLVITHSVENSSPNLGAKWTITAKVNGKVITLMDRKKVSDNVDGLTSEKLDGQKIQHTFKNATWKKLFSQSAWNNSYSANIILTLENDFGDSVEAITSTTLMVDYCEPVKWANANSVFTEKIKYASNLLGNPLIFAGSASDNAAFLVNAGEVIQLTIPNITDLNNDTNKTVYIERGIASGWSNTLSIIQSATNWTQIGSFKPSSGSVYEYTIPDISEDAFYVFRAWIKGTNTLESKESYVNSNQQYAYSPTVVRACRSRKPSIEITSVSDTNPATGVFTIKPFITLNASDNYFTYKNWERGEVATGGTSVKNITIEAQICNDGSFNKNNTTTYISGNILSAYESNYSEVNTASFSTISKSDFKGQTVFIRLKISIDTGYGVIKESFSPVYTYYAMSPTVSHRSHQVGINTNKFNAGEILALAMPSSEKNTLRFTGEEGLNTVNLYLNLSNLTLSSKVGNSDVTSKIKFGTESDAKITDFNLSTCTVSTSLTGSTVGVTLDNFTLDGGTW